MSLTIVAIPKDEDYVWNISSEKIPHMTILFLSDSDAKNKIIDFVQHASEHLSKFYLNVDHRGVLGPEDADVVFFDKDSRWGMDRVLEFRANLLKNDDIKAAFDSVQQYPEFTPHLTLGYPATPAKKDTRDYPGIREIGFDKIAVWDDDYSGPTFQLSDNDKALEMSDTKEFINGVLSHHGVKGMKWGVRRSKGDREGPSGDAARVSTLTSRAKTSGTQALSNKELQDAINRMNLEKQFNSLKPKTPSQKAAKFISDLIVGVGKNQAQQYANQQVAQAMKKKMA